MSIVETREEGWKRKVKRLLKKLIRYGLSNVCFYIIPSQKESLITYDEAELILNQHSPDLKGSPLKVNKINEKKCNLTIIVPVYNSEKFLKQCMESMINQNTDYSYQIIVVNDGSKDHSGAILEDFSTYSDIVTIINQENKGCSSARNVALQEVRGEYIMFVDSDDYLLENTVESLLQEVYRLDADIVQGGYYYINEEAGKHLGVKKYPDMYDVAPNGVVAGMPWGKVYKTKLFEKVCFPEGYWYEDTIITSIVTHLADRIATISDIVYCYRINSSGMTQSGKGKSKSIDTLYVLRSVLSARKELLLKTDRLFYEHLIRLIILGYKRTKNEPDNVKKSLFLLYKKILEDERSECEKFQVSKQYQKLDRVILSGDYRKYCYLCEFCL